ncbi:PP2C family protein-serine/threonine phosphatase [Litoreibacter arenae]|uniref:Serine phosphatase RsbU, regulator of sigma subunit n=1 Tax=Litoreibacter arenae DSM 19593 TaxID=1123360 RepID=S9QBY1_9RHOB|nr:SpoIIE family protein phosphatase [Litoreibacter arenae]EPX77467.1 Serine phosphatase RsbU, regulator of sigma subunit [Litoreibacter arenae DSM 19593]
MIRPNSAARAVAQTHQFEALDWEDTSDTDPSLPQRVLVVDDSRMQRRLLSSSLRKWGYDVLEAASGADGLALCKEHDISLVLSDWVMPGMSGPEFCRAYRSMGRDDYGYFILLTSKGSSDEIAEGLNSGADDFLTKPVNSGELRARLRAGERVLQMQAALVDKNHIVNAALSRIETLYDALNHDLSEARHLQQSLVRETDIEFAEGRIALNLTPSGHVGGDLVGQFRINDHQIGLFSLDVSGHGVTSALMTARLAGYLSGLTPNQNMALDRMDDGSFKARDPAQTVSDLNDLLLRELETEHYFTIALSIVDLTTGRMRSVQAGHPHAVLQRRGYPPVLLGDGGMPVGLISNAPYESYETQLRPGDRLVLYSDGITEAEAADGQMLEEDGLNIILDGARDKDGPDALDHLLTALSAYTGSTEFDDDVSALVFDYTGPP